MEAVAVSVNQGSRVKWGFARRGAALLSVQARIAVQMGAEMFVALVPPGSTVMTVNVLNCHASHFVTAKIAVMTDARGHVGSAKTGIPANPASVSRVPAFLSAKIRTVVTITAVPSAGRALPVLVARTDSAWRTSVSRSVTGRSAAVILAEVCAANVSVSRRFARREYAGASRAVSERCAVQMGAMAHVASATVVRCVKAVIAFSLPATKRSAEMTAAGGSVASAKSAWRAPRDNVRSSGARECPFRSRGSSATPSPQ